MKHLILLILLGAMLVLFGLATPHQAWGFVLNQPDSDIMDPLSQNVPVKRIPRQAPRRPDSLTAPYKAANFTVNVLDDPGDPTCLPGSCSLRAAIIAANTNSFTNTQIIDFDLTYPTTITLSSPLPVITGTVVISGPGPTNLTVSGDELYRVFEVSHGASLTMSGIAIRNGHMTDSGAGIFNDHGTLLLRECVVAGNSTVDIGGAGILNDFGTVQISECIVSDNSAGTGNGGGLRNNGGAATIANTTFINNHAYHNGAIENSGVMTITDSLIADSWARTAGGIYNSGTLTVTNSTFAGNYANIASGGAIANGGTLVVANSTFYENGAEHGADIDNSHGSAYITNSTVYSTTSPSTNSVYNGGINATLTLSNTILAAPSGIGNCLNMDSGTLLVSADNLATDSTCANATVVLPGQLKLGFLEDNGGSTPTIALLPGSVAIDSGDDLACAAPIGAPTYGAGGTDQRGVGRPQGEYCDVGAFEDILLKFVFLPAIQKSP